MKTLVMILTVLLWITAPNKLLLAALPDELKSVFTNKVSNLSVEKEYSNWAKQTSFDILYSLEYGLKKQYFVFVDRNPDNQLIMVGLFDPEKMAVEIIGWDKVSTGNPDRRGHFETPTGVFLHSTNIIGWRALGTPNEQGLRGLGEKGSRIWDFGWQTTLFYRKGQPEDYQIRLTMHATDPYFGEPILGQPDSKGCVRVSGSFNRFLDFYGILDADYEKNLKNPWVKWLLLPERRTVSYPGRYLIVADSNYKK